MNTNPVDKPVTVALGICFLISGISLLFLGQLLVRRGELKITSSKQA